MSSPYSDFTKRSLYHGYIPATPVIHRKFLEEHFGPNAPKAEEYSDPVKVFLQVLNDENILDGVKDLFNDAVEQAQQYKAWADPDYEVSGWDDFLNKLSILVSEPPQFYKAKFGGHTVIGEPIGVPLFVLFDLVGNTSAGYILLTRSDFNVALKAMLQSWGKYLTGPGSNSSLTKEQWFGPEGLNLLESGLGKLTFEQTYKSDNDLDPFYFTSWDSFFTRQFHETYVDADGNYHPVRPIAPQPTGKDEPFYVYNPCESTAFRIALNIKAHDTFWLKTQKYSLYDMLGGDSYKDLSVYADRLQGGSVLQSFLSPQDFHCWHSPIQGKVLGSAVIDGTYFAVLPDEGAPEYDPDLLPGDPHGTMVRSQSWLSVSATRAVFVIEPYGTDSPIDLIAFIAIGMVEVSSCEITYDKRGVPIPDYVDVGTELGKFHFGGSSCLIVVKPKKGYEVIFQDSFNTPVRPGQHRWIHSVIGQVWKQ